MQAQSNSLDKIWSSLTELQRLLRLDDLFVSEVMDMHLSDYVKAKELRLDLDCIAILKLCKELSLDEKHFFEGTYDKQSLLEHYCKQNDFYLNPRYTEKAHSRMFTLRNILSVARTMGKEDFLLKKLQVTPFMAEREIDVSCLLISDAFAALRKFFHSAHYYLVGELNALEFKTSKFGRELSLAKTPHELFERWIGMRMLFEDNWFYSIEKMTPEEIIINSYPNEELVDHFETRNFSNIETSKFRAGFAASLPTYIGLSKAEVSIGKSVHKGDKHCQFHVDLRKSKPLSLLH